MLNAKRGMRVVVLDATEMEETKTSGRAIEWRGMNTPNQTNAVMTEPPSPASTPCNSKLTKHCHIFSARRHHITRRDRG